MFAVFNEAVNMNKTTVEPYTGVSLSDSKGPHPKRTSLVNNHKRSKRRANLKKSKLEETRVLNERYIYNLSNQTLSNNEVKLLSRGLQFIPTLTSSHVSQALIKGLQSVRENNALKIHVR